MMRLVRYMHCWHTHMVQGGGGQERNPVVIPSFSASRKVPKLKDTVPCDRCMCSWIRDGAAAYDARAALQPPPFLPSGVGQGTVQSKLLGMEALVQRAKLPADKAAAMESEFVRAGAVHVQELVAEDWTRLDTWNSLLPFEQRRVMAALRG